MKPLQSRITPIFNWNSLWVGTLLGALGLLAMATLSGCQEQGNPTSQSLFWQQIGQFPQGTQAWLQADLQNSVTRHLMNQGNRLPDSTRQVAKLLSDLADQPDSATLCNPLWTSGLYHAQSLNATLALGQCPAPETSKPLARWLKARGFRDGLKDQAHVSALVQSIWQQPNQHLWWVQKGNQTWLLTSQPSLDQILSPTTPKVESLPWFPEVVHHPALANFGTEPGFARLALLSAAERSYLPPVLQTLVNRTGLWEQFPVILATARGRSLQKRLKDVTGAVWVPKITTTPALPPQQEADLLALFQPQPSRQKVTLDSRDLAGWSLDGGDRWLRYLQTYGAQGFEKQALAIADQVSRLHGVSLINDVPTLLSGRTRGYWQLPAKATSWRQGNPLVLLENDAHKTTVLTQLNLVASTIPQKVVVTSPLADRHEGSGWLWQIQWPGRMPVQVALLPQGKDILIGPLSVISEGEGPGRTALATLLTRDSQLPESAWLSFQFKQPKHRVALPGNLQRFDQLSFWLGWHGEQFTHKGLYRLELSNAGVD